MNFIGFAFFLVGKLKKTKRREKEDHGPSKKCKKSLKKGEADQDEVCHLSPVDKDCSKGMKGMDC